MIVQVVYVSSILMHQARHLTTVYGNTYNMTYTAARTYAARMEQRSVGIFMFTTDCCAYVSIECAFHSTSRLLFVPRFHLKMTKLRGNEHITLGKALPCTCSCNFVLRASTLNKYIRVVRKLLTFRVLRDIDR